MVLISILRHIFSFILCNWSVWAFVECHAPNPSMSSPKLYLDKSGLVFPAAAVHSKVAYKGCLGVCKRRRGQSHRSSFTFWKCWGLPLFSIFHSSLSLAPRGVLLSPPIFIKVSLQLLLLRSSLGANCNFWKGSLRTLGEMQGLWCQVCWMVFTCCLVQLRELCGGVWRQSGHVRETKCLNGDGSTQLPSHPHSPYPDKGKPLTGSDGAKLVRIALPGLLSSLPVCLPSFHSLTLSFPCHLASVFGGGLHKSWTAFPPGKQRILIEKEIRNENSHSFSGLCPVKARKYTRGKKTKCTGESVKEIGHVLKTNEREEIWHLASLCTTYNDPGFFSPYFSSFFSVIWVWHTDPVQQLFYPEKWYRIQIISLF